jgi:two-component system, NarL family, response regulator DevR
MTVGHPGTVIAPERTIRVYLTDDDVQFSKFVVDMLGNQPGLQLTGTAGSLETALSELTQIEPDVLVLDLYMGEGETLEAIPDLKQLHSGMKILVLTGGGWEDQQVASILAGAHGFLYKPFTTSDLVRAIRVLYEGKAYFDAIALAEALSPAAPAASTTVAVTEEERAFLELLRKGLPTAAIAARLEIGIKAVYQRRFRLKKKLGLRSSRELIGFAAGLGGSAQD